jgi:hypothetical protein
VGVTAHRPVLELRRSDEENHAARQAVTVATMGKATCKSRGWGMENE